MANVLGGATWTNPLAITGSQVNATNTTTPVTSKTGSYSTTPITSAFNYTPPPPQGTPTISYDSNSGITQPGGNTGGNTLTSGGGSTPSAAPVYVDPYASTVFGSTANFNKVHGDWQANVDATRGSIEDRVNGDYNDYASGEKDFENNVDQGQKKINTEYVQNELGRVQGARGVTDMVGTGVHSAGITLANHPGASTSSASEAVARAYGEIGQREMTKVGNQYELGKGQVDQDQASFQNEIGLDARHLSENKTKIVNNIATDTATKIAALNAAAAGASLDDRLNIEAEKERVRNEAMGKLSQLDGAITAAQGRATPSDPRSWNQQATEMANAGTAPAAPFAYTAQTPAQFSSSGPFASDLPLFQLPAGQRKDTLA